MKMANNKLLLGMFGRCEGHLTCTTELDKAHRGGEIYGQISYILFQKSSILKGKITHCWLLLYFPFGQFSAVWKEKML